MTGRLVLFPLLLLLLLEILPAYGQGAVTGCRQPDCLTCGTDGHCVRCARAIVYGTRQCVSSCPGNYRLVHSDVEGYQGLLCRAGKFLDAADMTTEELVVLVAALAGAAVCIGVLVGAFLFLRVRRKMDPLQERTESQTTNPEAGVTSDLERIQFLTRLQALRPETQNFLEMLTDTRKKFNNKGSDSKADSKHRAYRSILRDLSRILTLLNRKEEQIRTVPADWQRLLGWAERLLKRYKRQKLSKEFGSAPSIEYLSPSSSRPRSSTQPRRPRSAAGRIHTNGSLPMGSHFSISQAIIEEDDEMDGIQSLPPIGNPEKHSRTAPPPRGANHRRYESNTNRRRARGNAARLAKQRAARAYNASVPTGLHLLPEEKTGKPVYVHEMNGGHGDGVFCEDTLPPRPATSLRPASSARSLVPAGQWPAPPRSLPPVTGAPHPQRGPRPTYKDWPVDKLKHVRVGVDNHHHHHHNHNRTALDSRAEPSAESRIETLVDPRIVVREARVERERTSDFTDTTTDAQSHSGGSSAGLPLPPAPVFGSSAPGKHLDTSYNEMSDYIDKDMDSYSGKYFRGEEVSTVL